MNEDEVFLAHYGVKGMRWGIRRKRSSDGKLAARKTNAKPEWEFEGNSGKLSTKKAYSQSDLAALQRQFQGMQLERQIRQMQPKTAKQQLRDDTIKIVSSVLKEVGTTMVKDALRSGLQKAVKRK